MSPARCSQCHPARIKWYMSISADRYTNRPVFSDLHRCNESLVGSRNLTHKQNKQSKKQAVESVSRRAIIGYSGFVWNVEFIKMGVPYTDVTYSIPLSGLEGQVELDLWVDVSESRVACECGGRNCVCGAPFILFDIPLYSIKRSPCSIIRDIGSRKRDLNSVERDPCSIKRDLYSIKRD